MNKISYKLFLVILLMSISGLIITAFFVNYRIDHHFKKYIYYEQKQEIEILINSLKKDNFIEEKNWIMIKEKLINYSNINQIFLLLTDTEDNIIFSNFTPRRRQSETFFNNPQKHILSGNNKQEIAYLYWQLPGRHMTESSHSNRFIVNINRAVFLVTIFMIFLTIIVSFFLSRYLTSPLLKMNKMASAIANGNYGLNIKIRGNDEIKQLADSLNQLALKLSYLEKIREESTADLVHELRTPLAIIANYLDAIKDGIFEADSQIIREMEEELARLSKLVGSLEDLAETEEKILALQKDEINLKNIIKQIVKSFKVMADKKGITIETKFIGDNFLFKGDKNSFQTIIRNLLSNAIKYSFKGCIVKIKVIKKEKNITIQVTDTGIGIPEKDLPYIFARFYRTDKSRSTKTGGTGIGLTITHKLIKAHNGKITVNSKDGFTTFTIVLPL